jgi:methyl acetate hydrolase
MTPHPLVDGILRQATDSREVPGVVAMAATDRGLLYEGAFGRRALDRPEPMTLDSVFRIASMTKAITSVAAMQLVEQGKLALEAPVPDIDPTLGAPQVLEGFDAAGKPRLRPARRPITLRHLLTHTAGFGYNMWDPTVGRYLETAGLPPRGTGRVASIRMPLVFDPGDRWEYGINTDWVGRLVEAPSSGPARRACTTVSPTARSCPSLSSRPRPPESSGRAAGRSTRPGATTSSSSRCC